MTKGQVNINDVLEQIGMPGKYQFAIFFWAFIVGLFDAMQSMVMILTQGNMDYRCITGELVVADDNITDSLYTSTPSHYNSTPASVGSSTSSCYIGNSTLPCSKFSYRSEYFTSTVISQFDAICSREHYITLSNMLFMLVRIPGGVISGQMIDRLGRKKALLIGLFFLGAFGIPAAYAVNIEMYITMRCLLTIPIIAAYDASATICKYHVTS